MKIEIGKRAQLQVERISRNWQTRADYPFLFEEELEQALRDLLDIPLLGVRYPTVSRPHVLRLLLEKSQYHVYYSVEREETMLVVHAVWSARRRRGPVL